MKKKIPEHMDARTSRYVGDEEFGCYYYVRQKGWLRKQWYTTVAFRLKEYILPKDWMTDRGPMPTEEKAWRVGEEVGKQLYEEQKANWKQMYHDISFFDAKKQL